MAELDHRVKNILTVVQSLAQQTLQETSEDAAREFVGRLTTLSRTQTILAESHWERARLDQLLDSIFEPYQSAANPRIERDGPELYLQPKAAQSLALAFHELVTNASKYGALSNNEGGVQIQWRFPKPPEKKQICVSHGVKLTVLRSTWSLHEMVLARGL